MIEREILKSNTKNLEIIYSSLLNAIEVNRYVFRTKKSSTFHFFIDLFFSSTPSASFPLLLWSLLLFQAVSGKVKETEIIAKNPQNIFHTGFFSFPFLSFPFNKIITISIIRV